jgi:hypothetical protein
VDVDTEKIEVLVLTEGIYKTHGLFKSQDILSSIVLKELHFKIEDIYKFI